jgi:hypothetical protein
MQYTFHHHLHPHHLSYLYCLTIYLSFPQRAPSSLCMLIAQWWMYCHVRVGETPNRSFLTLETGCGNMKGHRILHTYRITDTLSQSCKMDQSKIFSSIKYLCNFDGLWSLNK